jgi:hypothetical protein
MTYARVIALTSLAMIAFACNSLLCRVALKHTSIDAASFTTIRLISGAVMLWGVARVSCGAPAGSGNWLSALALFAYAAGFSFAYVSLPASTGALLLFGAVQATMIGHGLWAGERFLKLQLVGLVLALARSFCAAPPRFRVDVERRGGLGRLLFAWEGGRRSHQGNGREFPARRSNRSCLELAHAWWRVSGHRWILVRGFIGRTGVRNRVRHLVHGIARAEGDQRRDRATQRSGHRGLGWNRCPR